MNKQGSRDEQLFFTKEFHLINVGRRNQGNKNHIRKSFQELPLWLRRLRIRLVSMRIWVRSLALLNGLSIWLCPELWCRSQMQLGSRVAMSVVQAGSCSRLYPQPGNLHMPQVWPLRGGRSRAVSPGQLQMGYYQLKSTYLYLKWLNKYQPILLHGFLLLPLENYVVMPKKILTD